MHSFKSDEFKIRVLTKDDAEEYNALLRYAFQVTEADLAETGWKDDEIKQSKFPVLERADVLGCFNIIDKKEELVAQFAVYPLDMNIYGERYEVGFVTSVCTYPEYTGHGLMKKLMRKSLTRMRDSNKSFALLYPYSIPLYRGLGWEIISNKMTYVIKDRQIPTKLKEPGYVRRVQWDDEQFKKLHTHFAAKTHGCLYRNNLAWEEYFRWDEDDTMVAIYYNEDDEPCGYMVYLISSDVMHIKELIYLNREAQLGLWEYIHAHDSMIDEVRGNNYYSEPIAFELDDSDIKETIRPYAMGTSPEITRHFIELRGIGIIDVKTLYGVECVKEKQQIDLVIKLEDWKKEADYDRLGLEEEYAEYLGNKVVCHSLPIRPGRNLAVIVETAAVNHRQKKMGYNAAQELYRRVQANLTKNSEV
jgi:GNAT superfamily N-acetyltransferase